MHRYGLAAAPAPGGYGAPAQPYPAQRPQAPAPQQYGGYNQDYAAPAPAPAPYGGYDQYDPQSQYDPAPMNVDAYGQPQQLPYVPEDEIDRSIDYGEYTFDSRDFDEQRDSIQPLDRPEAVDPFAIGAAAAGAGVAAGAVAGAGMGAATSQPYPALIDTTNNRAYDLASARLLIGRESKNDIAVHDVNASRTHAELRFEPQGVWTITDLGSTNGTLVNGREVATQPLSEGDRITIGMTNFMFTQA